MHQTAKPPVHVCAGPRPLAPVGKLAALLLALLVLCSLAGPLVQAQQVSAAARQEMELVRQERESRTPARQKLASALVYAARQVATGTAVSGAPALRSSVTAEADGRFKVRITADVSDALLDAIRAQGGEVLGTFPRYRAVYALLPLSRLEPLAERADVAFIGLPPKVLHNSAANQQTAANRALGRALTGQSGTPVETAVNDPEGDATHAAKQVRTQYKIDGTGIKVGILSDSLGNSAGSYSAAYNAGYVPLVTILSGQGGPANGEGGGLAMAEIVHRLAPGASLYFATGDGSEEQFAQNIEALASAGCKVIIDDINYQDESPFQDGIVAQAVSTVSNQGVLYFSSATDHGNQHSGTSSCWEGDFTGSNPGYLNFTPNGAVSQLNPVISNAAGVTVTLFWSEPAGGATSQYELLEYSSTTGQMVQAANDSVTATGRPSQTLSNVKPGDNIVVYLAAGSARFLHLDVFEPDSRLTTSTNGRVRGHNASAAANAFCVAATPVGTAVDGGPTGPYPATFNAANGIETFSADGPRRVFFNADGTVITPGNLTSTGGTLLAKPDFTAADGVTTNLPAGALNPFYGTSASAAHAGGLAALMLSYDASLTPAQAGIVLRAGVVVPVSNSLNANDYGTGILLAPSIIAAASTYSGGPTIIGFSPTSGPVGTTVSIYGDNFSTPFTVKFGGNVAAAVTSLFSSSQVTAKVPANAQTGPITVTTNAGSVSTASDFTVTVAQPPVITSANTASGKVGTPFSYQITATNGPTSFGFQGNANGLTINTATGLISGTPTAAGTFTYTLNTYNSGGKGSLTLTVTIAGNLPVVTSANTASGKVGTAFSYQTTATNNPTSYGVQGLPAGLSVDTKTGILSGTPTTAGTYTLTLNVYNASGKGSATLTLTVTGSVPVVTSPASASGVVGTAFSYQITATNSPTSFGVQGLPGGLSVDTKSGIISGTPTAAGTYTLTLNVYNGAGKGSLTLTLTITAPVPVILSSTTATATVGKAFSYQIVATNNPTSYGVQGLKYGLSANATTGVISGTPTTAGTVTLTLNAYNKVGKGSQTLTVTIMPGVPSITSILTATAVVGTPFSYQITGTNNPTGFAATGLNYGLSVNPSTGVISGTPTTAGTLTVTLQATDGAGTGQATLILTIQAKGTPVVSAGSAVGEVNVPFTYQIGASNNPTSYGVQGLPAGLTVASATGIIAGTPQTAGAYPLTLNAYNAAGKGSAILKLIIQAQGTPVITSALTDTGAVGTAFAYQIVASNKPTSFGATGLPAGLTLSNTPGLITGTPTTPGTYQVTPAASNPTGTGTASLTLTIQPSGVPLIFSAPTASGAVGTAFSYQIAASNNPTSFNVLNLPPGLTVNVAKGLISGTPTKPGRFSPVLQATNAVGTGQFTLSVTIQPQGTPVVYSATTASGQVGYDFLYTILGSNNATSFGAQDLPPGLSVNTATGKITGKPTTAGVYVVTLSATNTVGKGTETSTFTITNVAPVITGFLSATATVGTAFSYDITADGTPSSYGATGLPAGLSVNPATGHISGTPTLAGTFNVTISATNAGGTGTATLTLTVQGVPVISNRAFPASMVNQNFIYFIDASNSPTSYGATGLPAGLTIDPPSGEITGAPTVAGSFNVTLKATNSAGTGSLTLTLTVQNLNAPVITTPTVSNATVSFYYTYTYSATNNPTSYGATGLPPGLAIDTDFAEIYGTPTQAGTYPVTLTATNASGTGSANITIVVLPLGKPVVDNHAAETATTGEAFFYDIYATNNPTSYGATGLPAGLSIDPAEGDITGQPTTPGTYPVTLSATNAAGTGTATITISVVALAPPVVDNHAASTATAGVSFIYGINATNAPTSYGATGLPPGLSIDTTDGYITGTPTQAGTYTVTLAAYNAAGKGTATITITVQGASAPVVSATPINPVSVGGVVDYFIDATNNPTSYAATGLPAGVTVNATTGEIYGTPTTAGTYPITIFAYNGAGSGSATITLTVNPN